MTYSDRLSNKISGICKRTEPHKKRKKQRTLKQTVPADGKLSYKEKKGKKKKVCIGAFAPLSKI